MGRLKCKKCGNETATITPLCPNCGESFASQIPRWQKILVRLVAGLIVAMVALAALGAMLGDESKAPRAVTVTTAAPPAKDAATIAYEKEQAEQAKRVAAFVQDIKNEKPAVTAEREKLIAEMIKAGGLVKISGRNVYVGGGFYALTIDQKTQVLQTVMSEYLHSAGGGEPYRLVLFDGYNGKTIGWFGLEDGLHLD